MDKIKIELERHDVLNILHALALAFKTARREDTAEEMGRLYDRIHDELVKGVEKNDSRRSTC